MSLELALHSIVGVLNQHRIPYAVMGGLAVRVYAIPRFTNDVDIAISIDRESLPTLFESLEAAGCEIPTAYRQGWLDTIAGLPLFKADFHADDRIIEVDLFVCETPFQESMIQRRSVIELPDGAISFVSPEDLILLKLMASRPRDLVDIQDVLFTMGQLDQAYLRYWAKELSIVEPLRAALAQYDQQRGGEL